MVTAFSRRYTPARCMSEHPYVRCEVSNFSSMPSALEGEFSIASSEMATNEKSAISLLRIGNLRIPVEYKVGFVVNNGLEVRCHVEFWKRTLG